MRRANTNRRYGYFRPGYERWDRGFLRGPGAGRPYGIPRTRYFYHYGSPDVGGYGGDLIHELVPGETHRDHLEREYLRSISEPRRQILMEEELEPVPGDRSPYAHGPMADRYERLGFYREPAYTADDHKRGYDRGYLEDSDYDIEGRMWWNRASDEIASWFGDDEAQRRRELDAYFSGNRGRGPRSYIRSDERIAEDVNDMLTYDYYVDASEIGVAVEKGKVTLNGTVPNRLQKRRAEDIALRVSGVREVEDRLRPDNAHYRLEEGRTNEKAASAAG